MTEQEQTNKFLYKSQTSDFATKAELDIFQDTVEEVIQSKWDIAFSKSGYITDCILKARKFFSVKIHTNIFTHEEQGQLVTYKTNQLQVGEEGKTSTFFIPYGISSAKKTFRIVEHTGAITYTTLNEDISGNKVFSGEHAILLDFTDSSNPKIILAPLRKVVNEEYFQYMFARETRPEPIESKPVWWDTKTNIMKQFIDNGWVSKQYSIPVGIVNIENAAIKEITYDFNIAGFCDQTVWVNPDIEFGVPDGRDELFGLKVKSVTTGETINNIKYPEVQSIIVYPETDGAPVPETMFEQDYTFLASAEISSVRLPQYCYDDRTLGVYSVEGDGEGEEIDIGKEYYTLDADRETIRFNPSITGVTKLRCRWYAQPKDTAIYIQDPGELRNPDETAGYKYVNSLGCYVNENNVKVDAAKLGNFTLGFVASKSKFPDEKLSIVACSFKDCSELLNATEIGKLIESYNANLQESIELAIRRASSVVYDLDDLRQEIKDSLDGCIEIINRSIN